MVLYLGTYTLGTLRWPVKAFLKHLCWTAHVKRPHRMTVCVPASLLSLVWLLVTPRTVALQAPLFMEFSRREYWSGLPNPPPGDLPDPGIEPMSPASLALADGFFTADPPEKPRGVCRAAAFPALSYSGLRAGHLHDWVVKSSFQSLSFSGWFWVEQSWLVLRESSPGCKFPEWKHHGFI